MMKRWMFMLLVAGLAVTLAGPADAERRSAPTAPSADAITTLITEFRESALARDSLGALLDSTAGASREFVEEMIAQREAELRGELLAVAARIKEAESHGADVSTQRRMLNEALREDWPRYLGLLKRQFQDLVSLSKASDAATGAERLVIESAMSGQADQLLRAFESLVDVMVALEGIGIDDSEQRKFLEERLPKTTEGMVTRVQLAGRAQASAVARVSRDPSNSDLRYTLEASEERLKRATHNLSSAIVLLDRLHLPTIDLRVARIATTGKLTADVFQWQVLWGLTKTAWARCLDFLAERAAHWLFQGVVIVLTFLAFRALARLAGGIVRRAVQRSRFSHLRQNTSVRLASGLVMLVGFVVILTQLGVRVAPLLAGFGVAGVVIGFAMQSTLSNFAAGGMILGNQPFDIGDDIEVAGASGVVRRMSLVSTTILTGDNQTLVIPNSAVWGGVIRNRTAQPNRRVDLTFAISYEDDIEKAERVLKDVVLSLDLVQKEPAPVIKLHQLADSSVNFVVRVWTRKDQYWDAYWDVTRAVKLRFDQERITIPFPQRQLHIKTANLPPEAQAPAMGVTTVGS
jgi:small conductance mechanosensitive channel